MLIRVVVILLVLSGCLPQSKSLETQQSQSKLASVNVDKLAGADDYTFVHLIITAEDGEIAYDSGRSKVISNTEDLNIERQFKPATYSFKLDYFADETAEEPLYSTHYCVGDMPKETLDPGPNLVKLDICYQDKLAQTTVQPVLKPKDEKESNPEIETPESSDDFLPQGFFSLSSVNQLCFDVAGEATTLGSGVIAWQCKAAENLNQTFSIKEESGHVLLYPAHIDSETICVGVRDNSMQLVTCGEPESQVKFMTSGSEVKIEMNGLFVKLVDETNGIESSQFQFVADVTNASVFKIVK